jgi:hypothetical protein
MSSIADVIHAFAQGKPHPTRANTASGLVGGRLVLTYHGNAIAWWMPDGSLKMTLAGWSTVTTRARLNLLCRELGYGKCFAQKNGVQYFGTTVIADGEVVRVLNLTPPE